jgi:hypothetical protein
VMNVRIGLIDRVIRRDPVSHPTTPNVVAASLTSAQRIAVTLATDHGRTGGSHEAGDHVGSMRGCASRV